MEFVPIAYDLHVHTSFSPDSTVEIETYARAAQQVFCHVGFLDHYELAFTDRPGYLREEQLPQLLDEFNRIHATYPNTSLGLEVDYYSDLHSQVAEFCDKHRNDFDYLIGVIHTIDRRAITIREEMDHLVRRIGLDGTLRQYFGEVEAAIRSGLFDGFAHIDGVMRFVSTCPKPNRIKEFWRTRTLELGHLCRDHGVLVEVNLHGRHFPWGRFHPSRAIIDQLVDFGTKFYVGSDSHTLETFLETIPLVQQMSDYLKQKNALQLPNTIKLK